MNEVFNNPAGKLLMILREGVKKNGAQETWMVWSELLQSKSKEPSRLFGEFGKLNRALDEVERKVNTNIPNPGLYLRYEQEIREIIGPKSLTTQWEVYRGKITPAVLFSLEHCAAALGQHYPKADFLKEVPEIKNQLAIVMDHVADSDLPPELKTIIVQRIEDLLSAIEDYQLYGITEIEPAVHAVIGVVGMETPTILNDPANKKWFEPLVKWLQKIEQGLHVGHAVVKLTDRIAKLLTEG